MERPLSTLGGLVLIVIAGAQAWRAYNGFDVSVGDFHGNIGARNARRTLVSAQA
jgi:hypothetical protein